MKACEEPVGPGLKFCGLNVQQALLFKDDKEGSHDPSEGLRLQQEHIWVLSGT